MDGSHIIFIVNVMIKDPQSALSNQARGEYVEDSLMSAGQVEIVVISWVTVEHYYLA